MMFEMRLLDAPNEERRGCADCRFCQAAQSWWCVNKKARASRGTSLPGVIKCPFWAAAPRARWFDRINPGVICVKP